jgi:hypothetical protein
MGNEVDRQLQRSQGTRYQLVHLIAAMLAPYAPFAKVFEVVCQQVITVLYGRGLAVRQTSAPSASAIEPPPCMYYLFASYDYCCKGPKSNYSVAVVRSADVRGPYVGRDGRAMMDGYGTAVLVERPWGSTRWRGPGHCGRLHDGARDLMVYHAYDAEHNAEPTSRISEAT